MHNRGESPLIFIVGASRSGTTMVGRIVGRSPEVFTFHELHFFEQLWSPHEKKEEISFEEGALVVMRLMASQRDGYLAAKDPLPYQEEAYSLLRSASGKIFRSIDLFKLFLRYECNRMGGEIPCDQTPRNVFYIEEILELLPEARIVNMIRDPRDVLLSQKNKWKRRSLGGRNIPRREAVRSWVNYHPITITKLWQSAIREGSRFEGVERVHNLRFEDLLQDPESRVRELCLFLRLEYDPLMIDVPQVGSSIAGDSSGRKGVNPEASGRWKRGGLSSTELYFSQKIASDEILRLGYHPVQVRPSILRVILSLIVFPIKLVFALMLNIRRMKSIFEALRRRMR